MQRYARTRVKICGITTPQDARAAVQAGADAIGLIFHPPSVRALSLSMAASIRAVVPPFVSVVAVLVNPEPQRVRALIEACQPSALQFHGDEPADFCAQYGVPWIKALAVRAKTDSVPDLKTQAAAYGNDATLLLDTYDKQSRGGSGRTFDWSLIPSTMAQPLILAGGLKPDNIAAAIARVKPLGLFAVDVSSGVERAKGVKDPHLMRSFINEVRDADSQPVG